MFPLYPSLSPPSYYTSLSPNLIASIIAAGPRKCPPHSFTLRLLTSSLFILYHTPTTPPLIYPPVALL
jgi:hypothetical protein